MWAVVVKVIAPVVNPTILEVGPTLTSIVNVSGPVTRLEIAAKKSISKYDPAKSIVGVRVTKPIEAAVEVAEVNIDFEVV